MSKEELEKQKITLENIIAKLRYTLEEVEEIKEQVDNFLSELSDESTIL